jgi:hypothetical protein
MKPAEALYVLDLLPRYSRSGKRPWQPRTRGKYHLLDLRLLPWRVHKLVAKCNRNGMFDRARCATIDVSNLNLWCIQARVKNRTLAYMLRNFAKVQRWPRDRLPVIFIFQRHVIMWNGHHRLIAARLLRRKLRCMIYRIGDPDKARAR